MIDKLYNDFSQLKEVEAIALGGSRAGKNFDDNSDYDIYVYITAPIDEEIRTDILKKYCVKIEAGNHFWEPEDNCVLTGGTDVDIIYRNLDDFVNDVAEVVEEFKPRSAYTTCMWHNLINCKIIFDRDGRLKKAQERFDVPYPAELTEKIVYHNMRLLHGSLPAFDRQIKKAADRGDLNSVNHRVTCFMETYFDLIFALNGITHPGEKRLVETCKRKCKILPKNFEENIDNLFSDMFDDSKKLSNDIYNIINELFFII